MAQAHPQRSPWSRIVPGARIATVPRKPGLDGMRAVAVIAVIVYHLDPAWLPGGFFGVDVFFVVSGYLITSLLVAEFRRTGAVSLKQFWLARARRLLPSVVVLLGVVILVSVLVARDALPSLRTDTLFSLFYVLNWWLIFHKVSYFTSIGRPPLLLHLWSLAVEEQFYLIWPPVLLFLLRRVNLRFIMVIAALGAAASSLWMGILFHPGFDPSRAYFGTDAHAQGLLIGVALAFLVPPWAPRAAVARSARFLLGLGGVAAFAGLVTLMVSLTDSSPFTYPRGFVLVDLCSAVLIVMVVHPASALVPVASWSPLRWVGTRSYALYLWHWPIINLTRPGQDVPISGWQLLVARLVLMAVVAELSHRLVEIPFKRPELWADVRSWITDGFAGRAWAGLSTAVVACFGALLLVVPGNITPIASIAVGASPAARLPIQAFHPTTARHTSTITGGLTPTTRFPLVTPNGGPAGQGSAGQGPAVTTPVSTPSRPVSSTGPAPGATTTIPASGPTTAPTGSPTTTAGSTTAGPKTTAGPTSTTPTTAQPSTTRPSTTGPSTTQPASGGSTTTNPLPSPAPPTAKGTVPSSRTSASLAGKEPILAIGDSVMLAAQKALVASFGTNITVDAKVGRQVSDGITRLQQYKAAGQLARYKTVVIELGTNGPMTPALFTQLATVLNGVPNVVFYNAYVDEPWEDMTNATLQTMVPAHPGWILLNWHAIASTPGFLYPDGIHPDPTGATAYTSLLDTALTDS